MRFWNFEAVNAQVHACQKKCICILIGLKCTDMCKLKKCQNHEEDDILTENIDIENRDDSSEDED